MLDANSQNVSAGWHKMSFKDKKHLSLATWDCLLEQCQVEQQCCCLLQQNGPFFPSMGLYYPCNDFYFCVHAFVEV
jgi:hypothetical protein